MGTKDSLIEITNDMEALFKVKFGGERKNYEVRISKIEEEMNNAMTQVELLQEIPQEIDQIKTHLSDIKSSLKIDMKTREILKKESLFEGTLKKITDVYNFTERIYKANKSTSKL